MEPTQTCSIARFAIRRVSHSDFGDEAAEDLFDLIETAPKDGKTALDFARQVGGHDMVAILEGILCFLVPREPGIASVCSI